MAGYQFLLDLKRAVTGVLLPAHGGTGSRYGEQRVVVKGINSTGATIARYTLVEFTFATNANKIRKVAATDSTTVLGVLVGYFAGDGSLVEAGCPDGYEAAVQTAGITPVLIESAVTRGEFAFSAATDGKAYSAATAAAGAFGLFVESADVSTGATTARVALTPAGAGGAGGGGGATFGTPSLTLSTSNAAGSGSNAIRTNATIAAFDATVPSTQAFGDSASAGSAGVAARRDHKHAMPANPLVGAAGAITIVVNTPAVGDVCDIEMPFAGTWVSWRVFNDSAGSIQYDIWKDSYANFPPTIADTITASAKPLTSSASKNQDSTLTGWTTSFSAGDIIRVHIDSTSGGLTRSVLSLRFTRT